MAWSTREIAELAGTSLRAVRRYREVGLLPEPERHAQRLRAPSNGCSGRAWSSP